MVLLSALLLAFFGVTFIIFAIACGFELNAGLKAFKRTQPRRKSKPAPLLFNNTRGYRRISQSQREGKGDADNGDSDIEAQHPPLKYLNPFSPPASGSTSSGWSAGSMTTEEARRQTATSTSGTDENATLTPFTPARERSVRYAGGVGDLDIEGAGSSGEGRIKKESPLGLGRYFFANGVGIRRYESGGRGRGWKGE